MNGFELKILAVARAGDTVFIKCDEPITDEQFKYMEKAAEEIAFKHDIHIVIVDRCSIEKVRRLH